MLRVLLSAWIVTAGCATPTTSTTSTTTSTMTTEVAVVCGDAEWQAMGAALTAACRSADDEVRACAALTSSWTTCPADIRRASRLRDHFTDELIVMVDVGGEWLGAIFAKRDGGWTVVEFAGGDIP